MKMLSFKLHLERVLGFISGKVSPFRKAMIFLGNFGILSCLVFASTFKVYGREFLPLDEEGKIRLLWVMICSAIILCGAVISVLVAGLSTLLAWREISIKVRIAGLMPTFVVLVVWLYLMSFTGM